MALQKAATRARHIHHWKHKVEERRVPASFFEQAQSHHGTGVHLTAKQVSY